LGEGLLTEPWWPTEALAEATVGRPCRTRMGEASLLGECLLTEPKLRVESEYHIRMWSEIQRSFQSLCAEEKRPGLLATVPLAEIWLLPEQAEYLRRKLAGLYALEEGITAVSVGMAYHRDEIEAIPGEWTARIPPGSRWDDYSHAYAQLNNSLNRVSRALAEEYGGVAETATLEGMVEQVTHVSQYFPLCVSHRAVAEAAGLGWRGRHGLVVTPEYGPALRLATVFVPGRIESPRRQLPGCGTCRACIEVCPILDKGIGRSDPNAYREMCRRRIISLRLDDEVCGICVRRCWEITCGEQRQIR